jgi:hypothetical protein
MSTPQQFPKKFLQRINHEQHLLETLKEKNEHTDDDKTFILLLVPAFKKVMTRKQWAKMYTINVMRTAKTRHFTYNMHSAILHLLLFLMSHLLMRTNINIKTCQRF